MLHYLNSIDSIYLAADGRLHDPTGHGFNDARGKILRVNEYDITNRTPTSSEEVNVCLENCRRIAKFGWQPTEKSKQRLKNGISSWSKLSDGEVGYFIKKLGTKYAENERKAAQQTYNEFGWGFVFDRI